MEKYVFFGGKGGVGKTTVSCAYGLKSARGGVRTLVVSTDPAHSTADVFDQPFDDDPRQVDGHESLWAMEIDPDEEVEAHLREIKRRMTDQVSPAIVNELNRQIDLAHRTPGAYEAALFDRFIEVMQKADEWDRIVFDTSPTGGTLRLLALPSFLGDWIDRLVEKRETSIDLFEKAAIGQREARRKVEEDPIIDHLRARKERFEFAGDVLRNHAAFFLVLNPDELSIRETRRAVDQLGEYGLTIDGLVVNKLTPEPAEGEHGQAARYLKQRVSTERERLDQISNEFERPIVATIRTRVEEVKGPLLEEVADELSIGVSLGAPA